MKEIPENLFDYFGKIREIRREIAKVIIGQEEAINHILICLYAGGHLLLESMPGLAKSLMGSTLGRVVNLQFKRIQLTPDLTPGDILGGEFPLFGTQEFFIRKGPIFSGTIILADEFNRPPQKTQAAFMEAMQEKQITIGGETFSLDDLFTVIATRNPIETGGTFLIAEAILDRFMANAFLGYPPLEDEKKISVSTEDLSRISLNRVAGPEDIWPIRNYLLTKNFFPEDHPIVSYVSLLMQATRPKEDQAGLILSKKDFDYYKEYVRDSLASPRSTKAFLRAVFVYGFGIVNDNLILPEHVKVLAKSILRHRLLLQDKAEYDGITADDMINWLLERVPIYT